MMFFILIVVISYSFDSGSISDASLVRFYSDAFNPWQSMKGIEEVSTLVDSIKEITKWERKVEEPFPDESRSQGLQYRAYVSRRASREVHRLLSDSKKRLQKYSKGNCFHKEEWKDCKKSFYISPHPSQIPEFDDTIKVLFAELHAIHMYAKTRKNLKV